jgi:trimeric autotransporter adhesin
MSTMNIFDLTDTWNAGGTTFTAIKMNVTDTASAAASLLIDLQVGGVSQFRVSKGGRVTAQTLTLGLGGQTAVATNTALGFEALNSASLTGGSNLGVGYQALVANTTGADNTAVGTVALPTSTTSVANTAIGSAAFRFNTTGSFGTAIGRQALFNATTGNSNIGVGYQAGDVITTGERNTIIGTSSDPSAADGADQIVVGAGLTGKGDDTAFIGGTNGAYNEKNVTTWETTSDQRIKKNIVSNARGLEILSQIDVRNFEYRTAEEITDLPASAAIDQSGVQLGVIAQELQAVLPECVTENSTGVLSVNTDPLIWYLINAVKQLSAEIQTLKGN